MADEPSNTELAWRLDQITVLVQGLVSRNEYNTQLAHNEHRFTELERDIEQEKSARETGIGAERTAREKADEVLRDRQDAATTSNSSNFRQAIYNGFLPGIICALGLLVTILLTSRGGK